MHHSFTALVPTKQDDPCVPHLSVVHRGPCWQAQPNIASELGNGLDPHMSPERHRIPVLHACALSLAFPGLACVFNDDLLSLLLHKYIILIWILKNPLNSIFLVGAGTWICGCSTLTKKEKAQQAFQHIIVISCQREEWQHMRWHPARLMGLQCQSLQIRFKEEAHLRHSDWNQWLDSTKVPFGILACITHSKQDWLQQPIVLMSSIPIWPKHIQELPVDTRPATCQMPSGIWGRVCVLEGRVTHIEAVICACAMELGDKDGREVSCPSSMWAWGRTAHKCVYMFHSDFGMAWVAWIDLTTW